MPNTPLFVEKSAAKLISRYSASAVGVVSASAYQRAARAFVSVVPDTATSLPASLPGASFPRLLDADRDGDLDAVVLVTGYTVRLLANDGSGHLRQQTAPDMGTSSVHGVLLPPVDLDGDGDQDVIATGGASGPPLFLLGDGRGSLRLPRGHLPLIVGTSLGVPVDIDGDVVTIEQVLPATGLPSFAKKFVGDEIDIVQKETWTSPTTCDIELSIPGKPGGAVGTIELTETDGRTTETIRLDVSVRIPLVGGKIESLVADIVSAAIDVEHRVGMERLSR